MAKFPWGDAAFVMPAAFVGWLLGAVIIGVILTVAGPSGDVDEFPKAADLRGLELATCGWVVVWYSLLGNQMGSRDQDGSRNTPEKYKIQAQHIADRGLMNTMEQSLPFLFLVWSHAMFVNPRTSVPLAWTFVICRYFYTFFFGMYGQMNSAVELPQWTCYVLNHYMLLAVVYKCTSGQDLHTAATAISPALVFALCLGGGLVLLFSFMAIPHPVVTMILRGVEWDMEYEEPDKFASLSGGLEVKK